MHDTPVDKNLYAFKTMFTSHLDKLENSLTKMQKHLEERDSEIIVLMEKYNAFEKIINETYFDNLKKDIGDKNAKINGLEMKLEELGKEDIQSKKLQEKKIKEFQTKASERINFGT